MCEFTNKLMAWLDNELPDAEAVVIARHAETCEACRSNVVRFQQVSGDFDALCDLVSSPGTPRHTSRWALALGAIAAAAALVIVLSRTPTHSAPASESTIVRAPEAIVQKAPEATVASVARAVHRRRATVRSAAATPVSAQSASWMEPAIQIAIPADAVFPPGMMPEGFDLKVDVSLSADGSLQALRLRQ